MKFASVIVATLLLLVTVSTNARAQSVSFDYDRSARFASFTTYAWIQGTEVPDEFNHARVVDAFNRQLAAKRLTLMPATAHPDLFVAYHAVFDRNVQVTAFADGFGPYRLGRSVSARTNEIVTGTLVIDLIDARTNTIVWRGIAAKEIDVTTDPRTRDKNINRAAARLFKNYPPVR